MVGYALAVILLVSAPARAAGVAESGPAALEPISDAWARSLGYAFKSDPELSDILRFDGAWKSMAGKPLVGALEGLGHDPVKFIQLSPSERRLEVAKAKIQAPRWVEVEMQSAVAAARAGGADEAALLEAMKRIDVIRLQYASYLSGETHHLAQLSNAFDSAAVKVRPGSYERIQDKVVDRADVWGRPGDPHAAVSVPVSYAKILSERLARAEYPRDFNETTGEMKNVLRHFSADTEARRIVAAALIAKMKQGDKLGNTDVVRTTLKELVDGMNLDPNSEKAQDVNLLESIVRGLSEASYDQDGVWRGAMNVIETIGLKTKNPHVRLLAYAALKRAADDPVIDIELKSTMKDKAELEAAKKVAGKDVGVQRDKVLEKLGNIPDFGRIEEYRERLYQRGRDIKYRPKKAFKKKRKDKWRWKDNGATLSYLEREYPGLKDAAIGSEGRLFAHRDPAVTERPGGRTELFPAPMKNLTEPLNLPSKN